MGIEVDEDMPFNQLMGFMTLPLELRVYIYKLTWERRVINLQYRYKTLAIPSQRLNRLPLHEQNKNGDSNRSNPATNIFSYTTYTYKPPPKTLYISSESRFETLKHYKPAFAMQPKSHLRHEHGTLRSDVSYRYITHVYFNYSIDALAVPEPADIMNNLICQIRFADLAQVRYVQVRGRCDDYGTRPWSCPCNRLPILYGQFPLQAEATDFGPVSNLRKKLSYGQQKARPKPQKYIAKFDGGFQKETKTKRHDRKESEEGENDDPKTLISEQALDEEPEELPLHLRVNHIWERAPEIKAFCNYYETWISSEDYSRYSWAREPLKDIFQNVQEVEYVVREDLSKPAELVATLRLVSADEAKRTASKLASDISKDWLQKVATAREVLAHTATSQTGLDQLSSDAVAASVIASGVRAPLRDQEASDHDEVAMRDFVDDRPHLQFVPGPKLKNRAIMHEFLDSLLRWFPLMEGADEMGPERQIGYHWLGTRVQDGWIIVTLARDSRLGSFWTLKHNPVMT